MKPFFKIATGEPIPPFMPLHPLIITSHPLNIANLVLIGMGINKNLFNTMYMVLLLYLVMTASAPQWT